MPRTLDVNRGIIASVPQDHPQYYGSKQTSSRSRIQARRSTMRESLVAACRERRMPAECAVRALLVPMFGPLESLLQRIEIGVEHGRHVQRGDLSARQPT